MKVNVEVRDVEGMITKSKKLLIPLLIYAIIVSVCGILGPDVDIAVFGLMLCIIAIIPMFIILLKKANKIYQETWITKEVEFIAKDGYIYVEDKKMNINYDKVTNNVYVHNLEEPRNTYITIWGQMKATFHGTIKEPDSHIFLRYLKENNIKIEKDYFIAASENARRYAVSKYFSQSAYRK